MGGRVTDRFRSFWQTLPKIPTRVAQRAGSSCGIPLAGRYDADEEGRHRHARSRPHSTWRKLDMPYIDGFVIAVPTGRKQEFIDHALKGNSVFKELGATRILECWGDDVPDGNLTDFRKAVRAEDGETVVFSWIEWPDKATRDVAMSRMGEIMTTDARMNPETNPMPFDGRRMIFGGFTPVVEL
jgi:uncharacterized protein YbaA (DUF1428 family)